MKNFWLLIFLIANPAGRAEREFGNGGNSVVRDFLAIAKGVTRVAVEKSEAKPGADEALSAFGNLHLASKTGRGGMSWAQVPLAFDVEQVRSVENLPPAESLLRLDENRGVQIHADKWRALSSFEKIRQTEDFIAEALKKSDASRWNDPFYFQERATLALAHMAFGDDDRLKVEVQNAWICYRNLLRHSQALSAAASVRQEQAWIVALEKSSLVQKTVLNEFPYRVIAKRYRPVKSVALFFSALKLQGPDAKTLETWKKDVPLKRDCSFMGDFP